MEVETALDAALLVLENGGSTILAERTFNNIVNAFRKDGVGAKNGFASVWRSDFVAVSIASGGAPSATAVRRVGIVGLSLFRASEAAMLAERAAHRELDATAVANEVDRIKKLAASHNIWITVLAAACAAAFFTQTAGGDYGALGIAFVAAAAGQLARFLLQVRKVMRAIVTSIAAIISALLATSGLRLGLSEVVPATLIGSIIYMVPGIALVNGFIDLVSDRHMLVGVERLLNALFIFVILTLAVAIADVLL